MSDITSLRGDRVAWRCRRLSTVPDFLRLRPANPVRDRSASIQRNHENVADYPVRKDKFPVDYATSRSILGGRKIVEWRGRDDPWNGYGRVVDVGCLVVGRTSAAGKRANHWSAAQRVRSWPGVTIGKRPRPRSVCNDCGGSADGRSRSIGIGFPGVGRRRGHRPRARADRPSGAGVDQRPRTRGTRHQEHRRGQPAQRDRSRPDHVGRCWRTARHQLSRSRLQLRRVQR